MPDGARESDRTASDVPAAVRTFLIADVRGYTRYTHEYGDEAAGELAATFAVLARRGIEAHAGDLLELRGDEALGVFTSARDALRAAVDLQRMFQERTENVPALGLGVGIGLDAGEAVAVEGGYRGGALNVAARLCARAGAGEILATETVASLARRVEGIRFQERGLERLKGLDRPVKVIEVVPETAFAPVPLRRRASMRRFRRTYLTRRKIGAAAVVAIVAAAAAIIGLALGGGSGTAAATRVAMVVPPESQLSAEYRKGLIRAQRDFELETETIVVDDVTPDPESLDRVAGRLRDGDFDLVLWAGYGVAADSLIDVVREDTDTHVVYVDADLEGSQLEGSPNVTAVRLNSEPAARIAGYLGGLMAREPGGVSIVGGVSVPEVLELVHGFSEGARRARPGVDVNIDYSENFVDQPVCERIANEQIDGGSGVVFTAAGDCGIGAIAAAGIRGAWAVGVDRDQSHLGRHVLVSVVKHFDRAVELAVRRFLDGTLPAGETVQLGIEDGAVGIVGISPEVPSGIRKKVAREAARIRAQEARRP